VDNIDRNAATDHGVVVMNTPSGNTISTAEHAFTLMLSLPATSPRPTPDDAQRQVGPQVFEGVELNTKRLAILGMGRIGTEFAKRAQAFGMTVVAYDPFLTAARAQSNSRSNSPKPRRHRPHRRGRRHPAHPAHRGNQPHPQRGAHRA
jgi:D-3-phosphoglycerate dehydrogenase / 2-oxoglutarate reductase